MIVSVSPVMITSIGFGLDRLVNFFATSMAKVPVEHIAIVSVNGVFLMVVTKIEIDARYCRIIPMNPQSHLLIGVDIFLRNLLS